MSFSAVTYAVSKHYTDETAAQFGGLKGAPCKVKSIIKQNGQNIITLEWKNDEGETRESQFFVDDGTPIYNWTAGDFYDYGDLAIVESQLWRCVVPNSDMVFDQTHWNEINSKDGNYDMVNTIADLPVRFTPADRKMYYVVSESIFYYWNGSQWIPQDPNAISIAEIEALFEYD